jgi:transcriptional regulator with XRE-family HTH domain
MSETVGERIRKARVKYGMSQAELARRVGLSFNAMNRIERGDTPDPRASRIRAIADVLHVSTDYLLGKKTEDEEGLLEPAAPELVEA